MGKFNKKGQAALEFLTTYGWAFMVILVMIGALAYFGVLNPQNLVRNQCVATAGVDCLSYEVVATGAPAGTDGDLRISFTNGINTDITVENLVVKRGGTEVVSSCDAVEKADGTAYDFTTEAVDTESVFIFDCPMNLDSLDKEAGDKVKLEFTFEYTKDQDGAFSELAYGTMTVTVK